MTDEKTAATLIDELRLATELSTAAIVEKSRVSVLQHEETKRLREAEEERLCVERIRLKEQGILMAKVTDVLSMMEGALTSSFESHAVVVSRLDVVIEFIRLITPTLFASMGDSAENKHLLELLREIGAARSDTIVGGATVGDIGGNLSGNISGKDMEK